MRDFIEELLDKCSANNTKSRGFYIMVTVGLALLALGSVATLILNVIMLIKGWWIPLYAILFVAAVGLTVGMVVWLNRS